LQASSFARQLHAAAAALQGHKTPSQRCALLKDTPAVNFSRLVGAEVVSFVLVSASRARKAAKLCEAAARCRGGAAEAHPPSQRCALLKDAHAVNCSRLAGA